MYIRQRCQKICSQTNDSRIRFIDPSDALVKNWNQLILEPKLARRSNRSRLLGKRYHKGFVSVDPLPSQIAEGGLRSVRGLEVHPLVGEAFAQR